MYIYVYRINTDTHISTGMEPSEPKRPIIPGMAPLFFALSGSRSWWSRELAPDTDIYISICVYICILYTYSICTGIEPSEPKRPIIPGMAPLFFALSSSRSWWSRELAPERAAEPSSSLAASLRCSSLTDASSASSADSCASASVTARFCTGKWTYVYICIYVYIYIFLLYMHMLLAYRCLLGVKHR